MKPKKKINNFIQIFDFWNDSGKRTIFLLWFSLILINTLIIISFNFFSGLIHQDDIFQYKEGDIALVNYVSPFSVDFIDSEATEKKRKLAQISAHPVYVLSEDITIDSLENYDLFSQLLLKNTGEDRTDISINQFLSQYNDLISREKLEYLSINATTASLLSVGRDILVEILETGYFGSFTATSGSENSGILEIISTASESMTSQFMTYDKFLNRNNINNYIESKLILSGIIEQEKKLLLTFINRFLETNVFYSEDLTSMNREKAENGVEPVIIRVFEGENILSQGSLITRGQMQKIEALKSQTGKMNLSSFTSPLLYQMTLTLFLFLSINYLGIQVQNRKEMYLFFTLLILFLITSAIIIDFWNPLDMLPKGILIPMALFGLSGSLLFKDNRLALILVFYFSLNVFFLTSFDSVSFLISLANGISGVLLIKGKNKRMDLVKASSLLSGTHLCSFLFFQFFKSFYVDSLLVGLFISAVNGFLSGILTLAILPIFEHFLNASTPFRLIELSDLNMPIMKRMLSLAPGTYVHSLNVANLAETACRNINADALLARVGAYFHDIGKIDQAEYFIENQNQMDGNKHDEMKPSLSAAVIKSHVKIGLEKGRELNLPDEVLDIIQQHHGTGTISYFYDRAVKEKGVKNVSIDDFSHSGPKPSSREAATVMLADAIEAATRTLKKPTAAKLEKFIWDIIMDRFRKGELNECSLTLKDLEIIKNTFVHVLTGHFHSRIEYPDQELETDE